jgi:hypothetical protein
LIKAVFATLLQYLTSSDEVVGNFHGLVALYSCCETTAPGASSSDDGSQVLDMLTVKTIAEGYALKCRLGALNSTQGGTHLVWLNIMSHHYV